MDQGPEAADQGPEAAGGVPPVPVDFAAERTIVPRRADGSLDGEGLRSLVRGRIENLLSRA